MHGEWPIVVWIIGEFLKEEKEMPREKPILNFLNINSFKCLNFNVIKDNQYP